MFRCFQKFEIFAKNRLFNKPIRRTIEMTTAKEALLDKDINEDIKFLTQQEAIDIDNELFEHYAFSVDQLMELAGLGCATAISQSYPQRSHNKIVVCCGPGNNGGDGLVCARHLKLFGYSPKVFYPKQNQKQLFKNLLKQCSEFNIDIIDLSEMESILNNNDEKDKKQTIVVDAIFGFSFKSPNRSVDFAKALNLMHEASKRMPLVSIDIPSGWNVETGFSTLSEDQKNIDEDCRLPALEPRCLISLTAPKLCAKQFRGHVHYLSGRFCPDSLVKKYKLNLPRYTKSELVLVLYEAQT